MFRSRTEAAVWRKDAGLDTLPILEVCAYHEIEWREITSLTVPIHIARMRYELWADHRYPASSHHAHLSDVDFLRSPAA